MVHIWNIRREFWPKKNHTTHLRPSAAARDIETDMHFSVPDTEELMIDTKGQKGQHTVCDSLLLFNSCCVISMPLIGQMETHVPVAHPTQSGEEQEALQRENVAPNSLGRRWR